jgi:hypothetical protein
MSEIESEHVSLMARLQSLWERQVGASVEVQQARLNLEFHRRKVKKLSEESGNAESWEKVLEAKCSRLEEELKPSLLRFSKRLKKDDVIKEELVAECLDNKDWKDMVEILDLKVGRVVLMGRSSLIRLAKTVLLVRDGLLTRHPEQEESLVQVHDMVGRVIRQLGRGSWAGLSIWEAEIVRQVVQELDGVPDFAARIVDQLLRDVERGQSGEVMVSREVQTGE